jgi:hypothetical protein
MVNHLEQKQIAEKLSAICHLPRADLVDHWTAAHGQLPPKGISRRLLECSAAFQLQVKIFGGLKLGVKRKLRQTSNGKKVKVPVSSTRKTTTPTPGTRFVREWHGRIYTVESVNDGFLYDGEQYASLSQVARAITGARWSGPRFFGL